MRLKIGIIGTGLAFGKLHLPALVELQSKYQIVALCNKSEVKATEFARVINLSTDNVYNDYKKMLQQPDIEAVLTAVPIEDNYNVGIDVLRAKKHLLAEKPLAGTMQGAIDMIAEAKKNNVKLMVAENYRFSEEAKALKDLLDKNTIGKVLYFVYQNIFDYKEELQKTDATYAKTDWRQHPQFRGGQFLDGGVHDIALFRYLFGDVMSAYALGTTQAQDKTKDDFCHYVNINTLMSFNNNITGCYNYCCELAEKNQKIGFRIYGLEGEIYIQDKMSEEIVVALKNGTVKKVPFKKEMGFVNEFNHFYDVVKNNVPNQSTGEEGLKDLETIMGIIDSQVQGHPNCKKSG